MYQSTYFVDKRSGTMADTLLAYGLGELLQRLGAPAGAGVTIEDKGGYYQLALTDGLEVQPEWLTNFSAEKNPLPFIKTAKQKPPPGFPAEEVREADEEWAAFNAYTQAREDMKAALPEDQPVDSDAQRALEAMRPRADFWVIAFINDYRMQGLGGYNKLVARWWKSRNKRVKQWETLLQLFAEPGRAYPKPDVTASQLFNPHAGKGQNRPKADAVLSPGNEKSAWLVEYLKAVGLYACAAPRKARGGDLRKTYVLAPNRLELEEHGDIFNRFSHNFWNETAVKMDIIAALLYTRSLLEHTEVEEAGWDTVIDLQETPPGDYVEGFYVATYQQLSANAYTMMNLAFIGLPRWAAITEAMDRYELQETLEEHIDRIRALDESRSEGYNLLRLYRDFICGNQWHKLFDFLVSYGPYLLSQIERNHYYVKPFNITNLRRLLMTQKENYAAILQNEGFLHIAEAIRRSTIIPQYIGRRESLYEVRYGLSQTLKKNSHYKDDFITALSDFMQSYNEENAVKQERHKKQMRRNLTPQDIAEIVSLIDDYNPQLICNLLLAYGYATEGSKNKTEKEQ